MPSIALMNVILILNSSLKPIPFCRNGREISAEKRLCRELMGNYTTIGRNGRPVVNMSQPILVEFGLGLIQMDLDEKNKILSTSMWSRYVSTNYAHETITPSSFRAHNSSGGLLGEYLQHFLPRVVSPTNLEKAFQVQLIKMKAN